MEKKTIILTLIIIAIVVIAGVLLVKYRPLLSGRTVDSEPFELAEEAVDVQTSIGEVNLPVGTKIGGEPDKSIILEETRVFQTTEGAQIIQAGEEIDCEHEPGYPDPCDPY